MRGTCREVYTVHPCGNGKHKKNVFSTRKKKVFLWLSVCAVFFLWVGQGSQLTLGIEASVEKAVLEVDYLLIARHHRRLVQRAHNLPIPLPPPHTLVDEPVLFTERLQAPLHFW
jgi:hypothetical protein